MLSFGVELWIRPLQEFIGGGAGLNVGAVIDEIPDRDARGELGHAAGALRPGLLVSAHARARERLDALWRVALLAHPNRPLERGYARVEDRDGRTLISAAAAREARLLRLQFRDGPVDAAIEDAVDRAVERPRRAPYLKTKADQPKLL